MTDNLPPQDDREALTCPICEREPELRFRDRDRDLHPSIVGARYVCANDRDGHVVATAWQEEGLGGWRGSPTLEAKAREAWCVLANQERAPGVERVPVTDELVCYISRYGGNCRDCADEVGFCPRTGIGCGQRDTAIRFVLEALNYGVSRGFVDCPTPSPVADDGVREALDQAHALIQEAKGIAGDGSITDHLDFAEHWLVKIEELLPSAGVRSTPFPGVDEALRSARDGFAPCPTCHQYSHSIGEGPMREAFMHFQSMFSHRGDGIPTQNNFDDRTRDAAQVLMTAALATTPIANAGWVIERCAQVADMHDHRGDIGNAIRALSAYPAHVAVSDDVRELVERLRAWPGAEQGDALSAAFVGGLLDEAAAAILALVNRPATTGGGK